MNAVKKIIGALILVIAFAMFMVGFLATLTIVGALVGVPLCLAACSIGFVGLRMVGGEAMADRIKNGVADRRRV